MVSCEIVSEESSVVAVVVVGRVGVEGPGSGGLVVVWLTDPRPEPGAGRVGTGAAATAMTNRAQTTHLDSLYGEQR